MFKYYYLIISQLEEGKKRDFHLKNEVANIAEWMNEGWSLLLPWLGIPDCIDIQVMIQNRSLCSNFPVYHLGAGLFKSIGHQLKRVYGL